MKMNDLFSHLQPQQRIQYRGVDEQIVEAGKNLSRS